MQYGSGQDWMIPDHEEGIRQLKYAYDKGINVSLHSRMYGAADKNRHLIPQTFIPMVNPRLSWVNSLKPMISIGRVL
jgi:hypothetical protein